MRKGLKLLLGAILAAGGCNTTGDTSDAISALQRDVNGDGVIDLVVGAPSDGTGGRVYIFFGPLSPENTVYLTPTGQVAALRAPEADVILERQLRLDGQPGPDAFGSAVTTGDVNGDGVADIVVGAGGFDGAGQDASIDASNVGRVYIFLGGRHLTHGTRREASTAEAILYGEVQPEGNPGGSFFGFAVETADLNDDGSEDVIVGAVGYDVGRGRTYIFRGSRLNLSRGQTNNVAAQLADRILEGEAANQFFGSALTAGDFGGNGVPDLAVSATDAGTGRVYVFPGGPALLQGPPLDATAATVIFDGEAVDSGFGAAMDADDVDGDGAADLIVGAPFFTLSIAAPSQLAGVTDQEDIGRCYVFASRTFGSRGAGLADVILTGEDADDLFGSSVGAGDVDADGRVDLIVGAPGVGEGVYNPETLTLDGAEVGRAYVFQGGSRFIPVDGPSVHLGALDAYLRLTGERTEERLGSSVSAADVDRDGIADLLAGAPPRQVGIVGIAFVVAGEPGLADDLLTGGATIAVIGDAVNDQFSAAIR